MCSRSWARVFNGFRGNTETNSFVELITDSGPNPLALEADILALISALCARLKGLADIESMGIVQLVLASTRDAPVQAVASL